MKKLLGTLMIVVPFVCCYIAFGREFGFKQTTECILFSFAMTAWIATAITLLCPKEEEE